MRIPAAKYLLLALILGGAASVALSGVALANDSFTSPAGPIARDQLTHMYRVIGISMIAVLPVLIGVPIILIRYRRRKNTSATYAPDWDNSTPLEIIMWGVPLTIVGVLSAWLIHSTTMLDPYRRWGPDPLQVQVVGLDWKWLFIYPEQGIATVDDLVLPVDTPVELCLTTDTVMQSLLVGAIAGQIYAMPGMITRQNLIADTQVDTEGENTQFNGMGFSGQDFRARIVDQASFDSWAAQVADGPVLTDAIYAQMGAQGHADDLAATLALPDGAPLHFTVPDATMFPRIVLRYHQNTAVPSHLQPGAPDYDPAAATLPAYAADDLSADACKVIFPSGHGHHAQHIDGGDHG